MIKVGIKTKGTPLLSRDGGYTLLENMLIGDGFHWQKVIKAALPGEVSLIEEIAIGKENISLINSLPLETYLECVVGSEMNPSAPIEFLKAHAVISRSWAYGKIMDIHPCGHEGKENTENRIIGWDDTASHEGFHVCSDDHCQRYQGIQPISRESLSAIRETRGEVLTSSEGSLIDARFSKCCGGNTELFKTCWQNIDASCLKSFEDPWCDLSQLEPTSRSILLSSVLKDYDLATEGYGHRWKVEVSKSEISKNIKEKFGRDIGKIKNLEPLHRGPSGRIDLIKIIGSKGDLKLGKELWIRRLLSPSHLYSSAFEIKDMGSSFQLSGKGWGHGVGLCQIGAANMAFNGYSYKDILSFYYPESKIEKI